MMFKKSSKYVVEYKTREDAAEALKEDERVKEIRIYNDQRNSEEDGGIEFMAVETQPIKPKRIKPGLEPMVISSVGSYFIWLQKQIRSEARNEPTGDRNSNGELIYKTVYDKIPYLQIRVNRRFGPFCYGSHQPHLVEPEDWEHGICWGTAQSAIGHIINNCDWYWAVKYCLDLLEDWDDDDIEIPSFAIYFFEAQLNENPKLKNKLIEAVKKLYDDKNSEFYVRYHGSRDQELDYHSHFHRYGIGKIRRGEQ